MVLCQSTHLLMMTHICQPSYLLMLTQLCHSSHEVPVAFQVVPASKLISTFFNDVLHLQDWSRRWRTSSGNVLMSLEAGTTCEATGTSWLQWHIWVNYAGCCLPPVQQTCLPCRSRFGKRLYNQHTQQKEGTGARFLCLWHIGQQGCWCWCPNRWIDSLKVPVSRWTCQYCHRVSADVVTADGL